MQTEHYQKTENGSGEEVSPEKRGERRTQRDNMFYGLNNR